MASETRDSILALNTIRDVVGEKGMRALYEKKNNTEIYIPLKCGADHWMSVMFGIDDANEICRRLLVQNADGKTVSGVRAYVTNGKNRIQSFIAQIKAEVTAGLMQGTSAREVATTLGVSERMVNMELKSLYDTQRLARPERKRLLPAPKAATVALPKPPMDRSHWEVKAALVDEALLGALPTGRISVALGVSRGYIRIRRKMLEAAGKLKSKPRYCTIAPDRNGLNPIPSMSADHSANIGGMIAPQSDEVDP